MQLGNPFALWWLLLVAVLLLLSRRRASRPRRPVANLYLWATPADASAHFTLRRIRRHWLVILQALVMAAIVAALARPLVWWSAAPVALIVDISTSMAARDDRGARIEQAREQALAVVTSLPRRTRVRLVTGGTTTTDLGDYSSRDPQLRRALERINASAGGGDIADAVRVVRAMTPAPAGIIVISDHYDARMTEEDVRWKIVGSPAPNLAITALAARRFPATPADGQVITVIWNYGDDPADTALEIGQAGSLVTRQPVHIAARSHTTVVTDVRGIGGIIHARLTGADALAADDERFAVVPDRQRARVLLAGRRSLFLEQALATNPGVALERVAAGDGPPESTDADIVVCDRCPSIPRGGRALLMIPEMSGATPGPLAISMPDHPIASLLDTGGVMVATGPEAALPDGASIVLRAGPAPALVAYEHDGRRVVELRADVEATGLPYTPAFPVLIENSLAWLSARDENPTALLAGEPLRWMLAVPTRADVSIVGPGGARLEAHIGGEWLTVADTAAVGIYQVQDGRGIKRFAVNPVTHGESDLATLQEHVPPPASTAFAGLATTQVDLAPLLLLCAVGLLALEWQVRSRQPHPR